MKSSIEISKFISLVLRHKPESIGVKLDEHGWANVNELIKCASTFRNGHFSFTFDMLDEIVRTDDKQRYSFNEDKTLIRANYGHSVPTIDLKLEIAKPPSFLWHGTGEKYIDSIKATGLIPKSRVYVHMTEFEENAVLVGKRHGTPVLCLVHSGEMYEEGFKFYRSKNGVWMTKHVPVEFLEIVKEKEE